MPDSLRDHAGGLAPGDTPAAASAEEFIYRISHDLRSSVRALVELPQWIAEDLEEAGVEIGGPVAESLSLMNRHARRLDRMLVDLSTYSRVGRQQSVREVDLAAILDAVGDRLQLPAGFVLERSLQCSSVVLGERDIGTLLEALIDNAKKHHDRAAGRIEAASRLEAGTLVLTVTDDGPGIAPEFHERVFQPMTTLQPRDALEGTGLGLATVRKIAAFYGGTARLLPMPRARGTRVEARLTPAARSAAGWSRAG